MPSSNLTHLDANALPQMVDVAEKKVSERFALAQTIIELPLEVANEIKTTGLSTPKGTIFEIATIAGTQAAKKTSDLIPMCHVIPLDSVKLDLQFDGNTNRITIQCQAKATHKTGVEMEALVGSSIAALTIYDMCKALSHDIVIGETKLIKKTGGRSDFSR